MNLYSAPPVPSTSLTTATTARMTFTEIISSLSKEANRLWGEQKLTRPGSEYANAMAFTRPPDAKTNLRTGIRIHKSNPKGVSCDNPACSGLLRSLTHDREHCFQPGGGMEGQGGNIISRCNKRPVKKPEVATAAGSGTDPATSSPTTTSLSTNEPCDLSCAVIEELSSESYPNFEDMACIVHSILSTILDSGTTSNLIADRSFFWTYAESSRVTVKTANHGSLPTSGRGDCVAELTLGGRTFQITFTDCLHAPGTMINLLSIGHMLKRWWSCNFEHSPAQCQLKYHGEVLGEVPMTGNLFFIDLKFICPPNAVSSTHLYRAPREFSPFA